MVMTTVQRSHLAINVKNFFMIDVGSTWKYSKNGMFYFGKLHMFIHHLWNHLMRYIKAQIFSETSWFRIYGNYYYYLHSFLLHYGLLFSLTDILTHSGFGCYTVANCYSPFEPDYPKKKTPAPARFGSHSLCVLVISCVINGAKLLRDDYCHLNHHYPHPRPYLSYSNYLQSVRNFANNKSAWMST